MINDKWYCKPEIVKAYNDGGEDGGLVTEYNCEFCDYTVCEYYEKFSGINSKTEKI